ncbi:MAG: GrpB family protein [Patescibacteria group bacterium]
MTESKQTKQNPKTESKAEYNDRAYSIESYDPIWADQFEAEAALIRTVLGDKIVDIQHVGSTAVEGLTGKPTIDLLVTVKTIEGIDDLNAEFEKIGYDSKGDFLKMGSRLYNQDQTKDDKVIRLANLHIFPADHHHAHEMIHIRDYLREHPEEVEAYNLLKSDLYQKYPEDYAAYRRYKNKFMAALVKRMGGECC